jgi:hypothetical protein
MIERIVMKFNFFGFKKNSVIEDVEAIVPTPAAKPVPMTFDEALTAQLAAAPAFVQLEKEAPMSLPLSVAVDIAADIAVAPMSVEPVVDAISEAAPVALVTDAELAAEPEVAGRTDIVKATFEDVVAAYKIFLRRKPENQTVIESRLGVSREKLFVNFMTAKEFIKYPENINLILQTAREIEIKDGATAKEVVK